jgi:hypothetical protein
MQPQISELVVFHVKEGLNLESVEASIKLFNELTLILKAQPWLRTPILGLYFPALLIISLIQCRVTKSKIHTCLFGPLAGNHSATALHREKLLRRGAVKTGIQLCTSISQLQFVSTTSMSTTILI